MLIEQVLYSDTGYRRTRQLVANDISRADNQILKNSMYTSVIWINKREYPIIFRTPELRDKAYKFLMDNFKSEAPVTLDLEMFYNNLLPQYQIEKALEKYKFSKHLKICAQKILNADKINLSELKQIDAYSCFTNSMFEKLKHNKPIFFSDEQIKLFSETLRYPKELHAVMSPYTFWSNLHNLQLRAEHSKTDNSTAGSGSRATTS